MTRVFEGEVHVAYSQCYLFTADTQPDDLAREGWFAGQANGLCGAANPRMLFLHTGLHTGAVPFAVDVLDDEPALTNDWEDVVEVFLPVTGDATVTLEGWGGSSRAAIALPATGDYRVRYCATGIDAAREHDTRLDGDPALDRYLLQLWPAPSTPDVVLRAASTTAAFWHRHVRIAAPPPDPAQWAEAAEVAREYQHQQQQVLREAFEIEHRWGGRAPSARLREVAPVTVQLAMIDRDLLDTVAELDPERQRSIARWLARGAFEHAGIDVVDWAEAGLEDLDAGRAPSWPFTDMADAYSLALGLPAQPTDPRDDQEGRETSTPGSSAPIERVGGVLEVANQPYDPLRPQRVHRPAMAVNALPAATAQDPLYALLDTFSHALATFGDQPAAFIDELRATVHAHHGRIEER